ncbi:MAG: hypothetical protein R3B46_05225 [Phycisphaerales bacterium]
MGSVDELWHHEPDGRRPVSQPPSPGLWLAGHDARPPAMRPSPTRTPGAAFIAQAGVFLIMTVAAGWLRSRSIAWALLPPLPRAADAARPLDIYGIITLSIAPARLVLLDKPFTFLAVGRMSPGCTALVRHDGPRCLDRLR